MEGFRRADSAGLPKVVVSDCSSGDGGAPGCSKLLIMVYGRLCAGIQGGVCGSRLKGSEGRRRG